MMEKYDDIFVDRKGKTANSYMRTIKLINIVKPQKNYLLTKNNMVETEEFPNIINATELENLKKITIDGIWDNCTHEKRGEQSNVLGLNGSLYTKISSLSIPVSETTINNLKYYGAKMIKVGDVFNMETDRELPVTIMKIGNDYVNNYIYEDGDGVYLEYHDTPHFHMPLNESSGGYLILGKRIETYQDNTTTYIELSAFKIPYGYAIITNPYVIHNDLFLVGDYMVIYTKTNDYSTVTMKNKNSKLLNVNIIE
jgi:hypothetical protein